MAYTIEKGKKLIPADSGCFQYVGRIDFDDPKRPVMIWPGSYIDVLIECDHGATGSIAVYDTAGKEDVQ